MLKAKASKVSFLLYAEDLIFLAPSATDLQLMVDELSIWCNKNKMRQNSVLFILDPIQQLRQNEALPVEENN